MIEGNLFKVMQNSALGVIAMQSFVLGYYNITKGRGNANFPKLEYMFYILPIAYNHQSVNSFKRSNELYTALIKEPSIVLGLQERSKKMISQSFDALNVAFSKQILSINKSDGTIELMKGFSAKKLPLFSMKNDTIREIQDCSYKLGCIFAKKNEKNLQIELNIRF